MVEQLCRVYIRIKIDIVSVFEAVGKFAKKEISANELKKIEENAIPGPGSCGGMYTANTMASAVEALGMSLPGKFISLQYPRTKNWIV